MKFVTSSHRSDGVRPPLRRPTPTLYHDLAGGWKGRTGLCRLHRHIGFRSSIEIVHLQASRHSYETWPKRYTPTGNARDWRG